MNELVDASLVESSHFSIILQIRLPRIIAGVIVGAALAASGVVYQGVFRNPMADSYVLGVSAGAAVGASFAILLGAGFTLFGFRRQGPVLWQHDGHFPSRRCCFRLKRCVYLQNTMN